MKKLVLLFLWFNSFSQGVQVAVWRVTPKNVCPGDYVKIDFKFNQPAGNSTLTTAYFSAYQPLITLWQGNYTAFNSMPKETFSPLGSTDSCYYMYVQIPKSYPAGTHSIISNWSSSDNDFTITLPNISITSNSACIGQVFTFNPIGANSYTYSTGTNTIIPTITNTYVIRGTGSNGCVNSKTVTINAVDCTVGIEEHQLNGLIPTYYDLNGNKIEKLYNQLIIEQSGNTRKKVFIQN